MPTNQKTLALQKINKKSHAQDKEPLIHHSSLLLIFFKQEKELTQI